MHVGSSLFREGLWEHVPDDGSNLLNLMEWFLFYACLPDCWLPATNFKCKMTYATGQVDAGWLLGAQHFGSEPVTGLQLSKVARAYDREVAMEKPLQPWLMSFLDTCC